MDAYLAKLKTLPTDKYLMVRVNTRTFGDTVSTSAYPPYVVREGWVATRPPGEDWAGNLATAAKAWQPEVTDRLIALSRAFAARYDTREPLFETFAVGETALGVPTAHALPPKRGAPSWNGGSPKASGSGRGPTYGWSRTTFETRAGCAA